MALSVTAVLVARPQAVAAVDGSSPWSMPVAIASSLNNAARPALAYTPDRVAHALWETNGQLFYANQQPDAAWSAPVRIAAGMSPVMAVDSTGTLHALFSNQFLGDYDIYHITYRRGTWTLPINVSNTSGASFKPALAAGAGGTLYATWMDYAPGYWTIYIGAWEDNFWSNYPVPNARGQAPALAIAPDGEPLVAWQERVPTLDNPTGAFAVYISEMTDSDRWSMPINVSDRPEKDALGPDLIVTSDGFAQLVWVDGAQEIRYCFGRGLYWPSVTTISQAPLAARGPRITAEHGALLYIAWDEGNIVRAVSSSPAPGRWPNPQTVTGPEDSTLTDVTLTTMPGGGVTIQWVQVPQPGTAAIYTSRQASRFSQHYWLPIALHS